MIEIAVIKVLRGADGKYSIYIEMPTVKNAFFSVSAAWLTLSAALESAAQRISTELRKREPRVRIGDPEVP